MPDEPAPDLGFTPSWFELGIIDEDGLAAMRLAWRASDDRNPEHYRYRAFRAFLSRHRPLSPSLASRLHALGQSDADMSMGGAIMTDIVRLPECPDDLLVAAGASGRRHLVQLIAKRRG